MYIFLQFTKPYIKPDYAQHIITVKLAPLPDFSTLLQPWSKNCYFICFVGSNLFLKSSKLMIQFDVTNENHY